MNFKLNLKKFKKVGGDKYKTVMRHDDGHEITIAHNALHPKLRSELLNLPSVKQPMMNDGGEVSEDNSEKDYHKEAMDAYLESEYQKMAEKVNKLPAKNTMADGGSVAEPNKEAAEQMQKGATQSGWQPEQWKKNIKEGLGLAKGGPVNPKLAESKKMPPRHRYDEGGEVHMDDPEESMGRDPMKQLTVEESDKEDKNQDRKPSAAKRMADGGDVPPEESLGRNPMEQTSTDAQSQGNQPTIIINNGQQPQAPMMAQPQIQQPVPQRVGGALRQAIADTGQAATGLASGVVNPIANAASQFKKGFLGEEEQGSAPAARSPSNDTPVTPLSGPANMPEAPQAQEQDPLSKGADVALGAFMGGYNKDINALKNIADIQGQIAEQNQEAFGTKTGQSQQLAEDYKQHLDEYNQHYNDIMADIKNGHIDPEAYWKNHSKLATGIGIILAGFAPAGGSNTAIDFLNAQMNRNLEAQRAEMANKHNLLSALNHQFNNMTQATSMFNAIQRGVLADKIAENANKMGTPMAKATADKLIGELQMSASQQMGQLATRAALLKSQGNLSAANNPDAAIQKHLEAMRILDPNRAKEIESRYIPNVGMANIPISEKVRSTVTERKLLQDNINKLMDFQKQYGGTLEGIADPRVRAYGEALAKQVQDQYRRANDQGVFKPAEAKFVNGVISDSPTSIFSKYTKLPAYQAAAKINAANLNAEYNSIGLRPFQSATMNQGNPSQGFQPKTFKPNR